MNTYITRINGISFEDTAQHIQNMTTGIAHRLGIREMGIYRYYADNESDESLNSRIDGIIAGINSDDLIICQFPTGNGLRFEWALISHLKAYGGRIAVFLHDLEPLQCEDKKSMLGQVINLYNQAEVMIVPSLAMRQFLLDNGIRRGMKFVIQEVWDYVIGEDFYQLPMFKKEIIFIGNEGFESMGRWNFPLPLMLYGYAGNLDRKQNVHSVTDLSYSKVFAELSKGGFGLVWYKNADDCQYMEYSSSFSLAQFLAAGIPVIVPRGISSQGLIEKNHLGIIVNSLDEALAKVEVMNEEEYQSYVQNIRQFAPSLWKGYYTQKCLIETMQAFYRRDAGVLHIPTKVYGLDSPVFSYAVLKESYGGNLALSWSFKGNTDGFLIYDDAGVIVAETDNAYQHYYLIKGYKKENGFVLKAYIETLKGKLIISESELIYLDVRNYKNPKVSLIIPAYNAEKYIIRCVDTALAQSFLDLEIVIIDDGSEDETVGIVDWYTERYSNVISIHQENGGPAKARNVGMEKANGEYIGFMDSDDMMYPDMVLRLYHSAKKNRCDIAITSIYYITDDGYSISIYSQCPMGEDIAVDVNDFFDKYFINAYQCPVVWNKLYRSSLIKKHLLPLIIYEDEAWVPYILSFADKICYLDECLYELDRSMQRDTLSYSVEKKTSNEVFENHKNAILFYLENGNPLRIKILKELAKKELLLFKKVYNNSEYEKLWNKIEKCSSLFEIRDVYE